MTAFAQSSHPDSVLNELKTEYLLDSSIDYDMLLEEMESFLDSLIAPRSYFLGSAAFGKGYFNTFSKSDVFLETSQRLTLTPTVGYFHKGGLSLMATGNFVHNENKLNFYQLSLSPGYDYLKNRKLATGISYTKFFTKDSLSFYTTPIQNELYAYFIYRKWWMKPMIALSYGWGSRSDYMIRESYIQDLRLRRRGFTRVNSEETVADLSLNTSIRHDFYWLKIFSHKDHFRLTPQVSFVSGTQKFGFNQSANTYATIVRTGANVLYTSDNVYLDDKLEFQPLSLTLFLRGEYSIGKFFLQPQLIFDYYFPTDQHNFNTLFSMNAGVSF